MGTAFAGSRFRKSCHITNIDVIVAVAWVLENSRFPRNIDIPWNIGAILGDSPEY